MHNTGTNTATKTSSMSNTIKVILSIVIEVAIIAVWLVILAPWYNSTQIIAEIPNLNKKESISNPPLDDIKQYRMIYSYSGTRELIIDLMQENRAKFAVVYYGNANFEMTLLTNERVEYKIITDQKGPFEFVQAVDVPYTGPYLVKVQTEGDWSIEQR